MTRSQIIVFLLLAAFAHPSFSKTNDFLSSYFSADSVQVPPPPVQTDTTSGWKIVFTYPAPSDYSIAALQFPSRDTGYAAVYNGTHIVLLRSTDQGFTWDTMPTFIPSGPITFVTSQIGFCGGSTPSSDVIWKTTDGGNSWTPIPENSNALGAIVFANADTGLVLGSASNARTTDGGNTWNGAFPYIANCNKSGSFANSTVGYTVGLKVQYVKDLTLPAAGGCQKTTDAGVTWTQLYTSIPADLWGCYAVTPNLVFVCGMSGYVGRSTDGGITWDTTYIGPGVPTYSNFAFLDTLHGFVEGTGAIAYTSDGGNTWTPQYFPNTPWLEGIAMFNDSEAVTSGSAYIYRTKTMGMFSSVSQRQNPNFQVQVFPNPTSGLVTIQYTLPSASEVSFRYYDANGVTLRQTNASMQSTGVHETTFDASSLSSGVYYFTMMTGQGEYHGKIEVAK